MQDILRENLVGIYLHGSIALNAFRWNVSDVDFLLVVQSESSDDAKRQLLDATLRLSEIAPPKGLEWSVVTLADCLHVSHPVPFCLHYSIAHTQRYLSSPEEYIQNMKGRDADLAAYLQSSANAASSFMENQLKKFSALFHKISSWTVSAKMSSMTTRHTVS